MKQSTLCFVLVLAATQFGCGEKDKKKNGASGLAKLALVNGGTGTNLTQTPNTYTPSYFGVKLLGVNLVPDIDSQKNPVGVSPVIWANANCKVETQTSVEKSGDEEISREYASIAGECNDSMVTSFFELSRPSETVNADLNSQNLKVLPGSYKYVTLEFCKGGAKTDNISFQADGMSSSAEVKLGTCGINSVEANPPIVVGENEAVTISVEYSLTDIVYDYGPGSTKYDNCYWTDTVRRCINMPTIKPSFSKQ